MTDFDRLFKRRQYISDLIERGESVDAREVAKLFGGSYTSVLNDIDVVTTGQQRYKKRQSTTQNTRARKNGVAGELSHSDWESVLKKYGKRCLCCGSDKDIAIDHVIPISKGGTNTADNIQPLCRSCNSSKRDKTIDYRQ